MWALGAALALTLAGAVLPWFEFGRAALPLWAACAAAGLLLLRSILTQARQEQRHRETQQTLKSISESLSKLEEAAERREEREQAEEEANYTPPPNATAEEIASFFGVELASKPESDS